METALKEEEKHDYPNTEREGKTGNERERLNTAQIRKHHWPCPCMQ